MMLWEREKQEISTVAGPAVTKSAHFSGLDTEALNGLAGWLKRRQKIRIKRRQRGVNEDGVP